MFRAFGITMVVVGIAMLFKWRRRCVLELRWPTTLTYFSMKRRVEVFLLAHGWSVERTDNAGHEFIIKKNANEFLVKCYLSDEKMFSLAITDCSETIYQNGFRPMLFVSAFPVPNNFVCEAAQSRIFMVHYRQLGEISELNPASEKAVFSLISSQCCRHYLQLQSGLASGPFRT